MGTTLINAMTALSKYLGDYFKSTTTGAGTTTTLVDTALMAKQNDWVTQDCWVLLEEEPAGAANLYDERFVQSLDNTSGTLTTLAFDAAPGTGIDYSVHRLFSPSEKKRALVDVVKACFPNIYESIWDESLVSGNWLLDGSFDIWTDSATLTYWTATTITVAKTTTPLYLRGSSYSAKLSGATGTLVQSITNFSDLQWLRGKTVTFTCQGWCDTASALRLSISDGVTTTYSSYHAGNSKWTNDNPRIDSFYCQQQIDKNATNVTFTVYLDNAAATAYVDDARAVGPERGRLYIGHLGLAQNYPSVVEISDAYTSQKEPAQGVQGWKVDPAGFVYIPTDYHNDRTLRIIGKGYLDFLLLGVASTDWTAEVNIEEPQLDILVSMAAIELCRTKILPVDDSAATAAWRAALKDFKDDLVERIQKFSMPVMPIHTNRS